MDVEAHSGIQPLDGQGKKGRSGWLKCLCQTVSIIRYFPFLMITILFGWGIFVYFYYNLPYSYDQLWCRVLVASGFLPLFILSYTSFIACTFCKHRPVNGDYRLPEGLSLSQMNDDEINHYLEHTIIDRNLPIHTRSFGGFVRYCRKCSIIKPDRCHHCSMCNVCIRKMDHHCHWVSNCVGYDNYKYFVQFLSYTTALALYTSLSSLNQVSKFWSDEMFDGKFQVFFLVVLCSVFSLSLMFLLGYHIYLLLNNRTTIEAYQKPRFLNDEFNDSSFSLGSRNNFYEVFGDRKLYWFIPLQSPFHQEDGVQFRLKLCNTHNHSYTVGADNNSTNLMMDRDHNGHNHC